MQIERLEKTRVKLNAVSPSFCLAKWYQVTLHLFNGNTQSCHHVKSHRVPLEEIEANPAALHNSKYKKTIRAKMLKGHFPKECRYCWNVEKVEQYSDRIHKSAERWAAPNFDMAASGDAAENVYPTYLEVAFSNLCNFKCMYCSPAYSSLWEQEIKQYGAYPTSRRFNNSKIMRLNQVEPLAPKQRAKYVQAFWQWWPEVSPHLHHLRVTGGEPFLSADTWNLMDSLIQNPQPNLTLAINSNMGISKILLNRFLEKLEQLNGKVRKFALFCSIDSVGPQAEFIRFGLNFDKFMENTNRILHESPVPIRLSYMITVNALSLPGFPALLQLIGRQRLEFPRHEIRVDTPYLHYPEHLSVFILPNSFEKYFQAALEEMERQGFSLEERQKVERIYALFRSGAYAPIKKSILRRDFIIMLREHDRRRKTDFRKTFPEYADFFGTCERLLRVERILLRPFDYIAGKFNSQGPGS